MTSERRVPGAVVGTVIALLAAGIAMLGWAFLELQGRYGPNYGAALPDGRVVLASHGHLHVFQGERRVARIAFGELGLGAMVTDLDGAADGALLVADVERRALVRCELDSRRCALFYQGALRRSFKAALEPGSGRVVVSDSSNHRLLLLDAQGRVRHATPTNGPRFTFPNGIAFLADGSLAVADTDHRRIAFLKPGESDLGARETELRTRSVFPGSDLLHPIDVVADASGRLWAILASNSLETGAVVSMQPDGSRPLHTALPAPADPLSLVALADAVLILEPTQYRVTRVALAGGAAAPFGDAAFQGELRAEAARRSRALLVRELAQGVLVIALVAALAIAVLSRTMLLPQLRPQWSIPAAPTPLEGGVDWIAVNPLPARAMMLAYLAVSLLLFGGYYFWLQSVVKVSPEDYWRLHLLLAFLVLVTLYVLLVVRRMSRGRIGTDGALLYVEDAGRKFQAPLGEVLYSGTRLLSGAQLVVLRVPWGDRYPSERVAGAILARLPPEARRGEWRLGWTYLARAWREALWWRRKS